MLDHIETEDLKFASKGAYKYWYDACIAYMDDPASRSKFNIVKKYWDIFLKYDEAYRDRLEYHPEREAKLEKEH